MNHGSPEYFTISNSFGNANSYSLEYREDIDNQTFNSTLPN